MLVDSINDSADDLVRLEIRAGTSGTVLSSRSIAWNLFTASNVPTDFLLPFGTATANLPLSFEVYWHHATNTPGFTLNDVTIDGAYNWVAANLAHEIGRLDGLNGWEADPIRDRSSGNLVKGPGTGELPAGDCHARFELKVDNFDRDQAKVATLSVVDAETGKIVASRGVTRDQFPDTLYHTFSLNFRAVAGEAYDFRTYWYFAPDAPRLTQRSVVVQASDR
jgi:hypothetical protein